MEYAIRSTSSPASRLEKGSEETLETLMLPLRKSGSAMILGLKDDSFVLYEERLEIDIDWLKVIDCPDNRY
jgi:hypothetical protein